MVCEEDVRTSGAAASIRLIPDRQQIQADGRDVSLVKIEVVDKDGYPVADAANRIELSVEGTGRLIGMDNGDPRDHTGMKNTRRNVFHGLALGVIQSQASEGWQDGIIRVRASSPGLGEALVEIRTEAP